MKIAVVYNRDSQSVINLFGMPNQEKIGRETIDGRTASSKPPYAGTYRSIESPFLGDSSKHSFIGITAPITIGSVRLAGTETSAWGSTVSRWRRLGHPSVPTRAQRDRGSA